MCFTPQAESCNSDKGNAFSVENRPNKHIFKKSLTISQIWRLSFGEKLKISRQKWWRLYQFASSTPLNYCIELYHYVSLTYCEKMPQDKHYLSYYIVNFARILIYQCSGRFVYPEAESRARWRRSRPNDVSHVYTKHTRRGFGQYADWPLYTHLSLLPPSIIVLPKVSTMTSNQALSGCG